MSNGVTCSQKAPQAAGQSKKPRPCCSETLGVSRGYSSLRVLGSGSFGVAMLVHDADGNERVMKGVDLSRRSQKHRLAAAGEVEVMQRLRHPYIVRLRESFMEEDTLAIVMDFASAGDLRQQVRTAKFAETTLPENHLVRWITQALLGVRYMHNLSIIHRDLKSENLFLETADHLRIGDFGISCTVSDPAKPFVEKNLVGTPYYLAPEICSFGIYSASSDIWALGCVLFELAALAVPFTASSLSELMADIKSKPAPPLPEHYSSELAALCRALLSRSRLRRPTASSVLQQGILHSMVDKLLAECQQTSLSISRNLAASPIARSSAVQQGCSPTVVIDSPRLRSEVAEPLVDMKATEAPSGAAPQHDDIGAGLHVLELANAIQVVQDRHGYAPQSVIADCALLADAVEKHGYLSRAERARVAPHARRDASSMPPLGSRAHDQNKLSLPVGIASSSGHPLGAHGAGHATSQQAHSGYVSSACAMTPCASNAPRSMADHPKHISCEQPPSLDIAGAMLPGRPFNGSVAESSSPVNMLCGRDRHGDVEERCHHEHQSSSMPRRSASASPFIAVGAHPDSKVGPMHKQPPSSTRQRPASSASSFIAVGAHPDSKEPRQHKHQCPSIHRRPASASPSSAVGAHPDSKGALFKQPSERQQNAVPVPKGHGGYASSAGGLPARPLSASLGSAAGAPAKMLRSLKRQQEQHEVDRIEEKGAYIGAGGAVPQLPSTFLPRVEATSVRLPPHLKNRSSSSSALLLRSTGGLGPVPPPLPPPLPLPPASRRQDMAEDQVSKQRHKPQEIGLLEPTQFRERRSHSQDVQPERRRHRVVPCPHVAIPAIPSLEHAGVPLEPAGSSLDDAGRMIERSTGNSAKTVPKLVPPPLNLASIQNNVTGNLSGRRLPPSGRLSVRSASASALSSALSSARRRLHRALSWADLGSGRRVGNEALLRPRSSRSPRRAERLPLQSR